MPITLKKIQHLSTTRSKRWIVRDPWSPLEWAGAMCGEAGEAANAAKKLKRIQSKIRNLNTEPGRRAINTTRKAKKAIAKEAAVTILYAILLIEHVEEDVETHVREAFNSKSKEYGFPERL